MQPVTRLSTRRVRAGFLTAIVSAFSAMPATAQRVELDGVASRGDRDATHRMLGYSARVSIPVIPFLSAGIGYSRLAGSGTIENVPCGGFAGCAEERYSNDFVFGIVDYELVLPFRLLGMELSAAAGVDATSVRNATVTGEETGTILQAEAPAHDLLGSLTSFNGRHYRFGAGLSPLPGVPLTLRAAWQHRNTDLDACSADGWAPFCGGMKADQLLVGLTLGTR